MKVDDIPALHETVSGKLVSNKRVQQWEQEFLSQQRRFDPKGEAPRSASRDQSLSPQQKGVNGSSAPRGQASGRSDSARGLHTGGILETGPKVSGQRVAGIYNRLSSHGSVPGGNRSQAESAGRPGATAETRLVEVRALLGRLRGHLAIEKDGVVSVWLGTKLCREERARIIDSIKTMLAHYGFTMGKLTINGIEEEI